MEKLKFSVTKNGVPLAPELYTWDEKTRTFSTGESGLELDFTEIVNCTFKTLDNCTFNTGHNCTFDTGECCTFKTGHNCTFKTWDNCTFDTGSDCTFNTGVDCTFDAGYNCTFKAGNDCTFKTRGNCTFDTGNRCTFNTGSSCTFKTKGRGVIVRRDIFEIIQPEKGITYKLCPSGVRGYLTKKINEDAFYMDIDGKRVECIIADGILSKVVKKEVMCSASSTMVKKVFHI